MKKKILAMLMIMIMCVPFVTPIQANAASQVTGIGHRQIRNGEAFIWEPVSTR